MKARALLYYNIGSREMEHVSRNIDMFRQLGLECEPFSYFPVKLLYRRCDYLYLNWYENVYQGSLLIAWLMCTAKRVALLLARIKGVKIISSQHNKVQHGGRHRRLSLSMFSVVYRSSSRIVVFNRGAEDDLKAHITPKEIEEKAFYIPPVNYIGSYPFVWHEHIEKLRDNDKLNILFVGNMSQTYKNVEMVIDIAKSLEDKKIKFLFVGNVSSSSLKEHYMDKIGSAENIFADFRYVNDDEMAHLLYKCDVVIAPYDVQSISNSATTRLAFSYGRTVICPNIPSLDRIPDNLIYTYEYGNTNEHVRKLRDTILRAYDDFQRDASAFGKKGEKLKTIMQEHNSPEVIRKQYEELFNSFDKDK